MPLIWHLLKIFSFCFDKVSSKVGNPKACDVLIFAFCWASESWLVLKFNLLQVTTLGSAPPLFGEKNKLLSIDLFCEDFPEPVNVKDYLNKKFKNTYLR